MIDIPARLYNDLETIARQWREQGRNLALPRDNTKAPKGYCFIKNNTGVGLAFGACVGIGEPVISPIDNVAIMREAPLFYGETPSSSHYGKYAVMQEPVPAGGTARACFHGVCWATLSIAHSLDRAVEVNGAVVLRTGYVGSSRILWGSVSLAGGFIRLGDPLYEFFGKPNAIIAAGGSGTINAWAPTFGGSALGPTIASVYNHSSTDWPTTAKIGGTVVQGVAVGSRMDC